MSKQRELKFRLWDAEAKKFMDRDEMELLRLNPSMNLGVSWMDLSDCYGGPTGPIIWLQFTGLRDKSGKEIYEGDIVTFTVPEGAGQVELPGFRKGTVSIQTDGVAFGVFKNEYCRGAFVIGNIHEHPELLNP